MPMIQLEQDGKITLEIAKKLLDFGLKQEPDTETEYQIPDNLPLTQTNEDISKLLGTAWKNEKNKYKSAGVSHKTEIKDGHFQPTILIRRRLIPQYLGE